MRIALTKTENSIKHQHYIDWLKGNDTIEVVTIDARHHNPDLIASCDGLVLSGGVDITPALYGSLKHDYDNAPDTFNKPRDEFEIEAYENALKNNIPILGICRGFQLINCINGGTLHQDLGESLNTIHWGEKKPADKIHLVTVEKKTLLE
jgi:putative glutamine amidotransferase